MTDPCVGDNDAYMMASAMRVPSSWHVSRYRMIYPKRSLCGAAAVSVKAVPRMLSAASAWGSFTDGRHSKAPLRRRDAPLTGRIAAPGDKSSATAR